MRKACLSYKKRGAVLVEALLVLPLLFLILVAITDFALFLVDYILLAQYAREIALIGGRLPGLSSYEGIVSGPYENPTNQQYQDCAFGGSANSNCPVVILHFKARRLLESRPLRVLQQPEVKTILTQHPSYTFPDSTPECLLWVKFSAVYSGIFSFYAEVPFQGRAVIGYLSTPYSCPSPAQSL